MARVVTGALTLSALTVGSETQPSSTRTGAAVLELQSQSGVDPKLVQFRNTSTIIQPATSQFDALNASGTRVTYSQIQQETGVNTAGSHAGIIVFNVARAGTLTQALSINGTGVGSSVVVAAGSSGSPSLGVNCTANGASGLVVTDGTQAFAVYTGTGVVALGAITPSSLNIVTNSSNRITISSTGAITVPTSSSLTVQVTGGNGLVVSAASGQGANIFVNGNGSTVGTQGLTIAHNSSGAFIQTNTTDYLFIETNGVTRITVSPTGALSFYNGASGWAQLSGWGSPTGAAVVSNFPGATATLLQCSEALAYVIGCLKALGAFAS